MSKIGLVTGSFDPVTLGHLDVIERASQLFDQLYVGIFFNEEKIGLFSIEERKAMLEHACHHLSNVSVLTSSEELAVEVADKFGVTHLVRGLRNGQDLIYEANLEYFNKGLNSSLDTVYLMASHDLQPISSSRVRELISFGVDCSAYVPEVVVKEVEKKCGKN